MKKMNFDLKGSFGTKNVKYGAYSSALIAIVVAIAVVINLLAGQLPAKFKSIDLSPGNLYSIGSETEEFLSELSSDVTITVLSAEDTADQTLKTLLERYEDTSDHIKVKYADPTLDIGLATTYSGLNMNSLVVACGTKEKTIDYYSIYVSDYSSYYTTGAVSTSFDGEGQITSAIAYVTSEDSPALYYIVGHGEGTMSQVVLDLVTKQNIEASELNLMTSGGIPEDCSALMIYAPTADYTAEEANLIIDYINSGGSVIALTSYTGVDMPNFESILAAYGIGIIDGVAMEGNGNYYQSPLGVIPNIVSTELTEDLISESANILIPSALGLTQTGVEGVSAIQLLSSSTGAYVKPVINGQISTYEKEAGDTEGPFGYAYLLEKNTSVSADGDDSSGENGDVMGKLIVISAASLIDDSVTQSFTLGNLDFFMNCMSYLCGDEGSALNISIESKSLDASLMAVSSSHVVVWMLIAILIIPLAILIAGLTVWLRRIKR